MTEKIARRGVRVPSEYAADFLGQVAVRDVASAPVVTLNSGDTLRDVRAWFHSGALEAHHQGYPVMDEQGQVQGVVTRRDILEIGVADERCIRDLIKRPPVVIDESRSLREAADHMVREEVGRLIVLAQSGQQGMAQQGMAQQGMTQPRMTQPRMTGILTRGDLLAAHGRRLKETTNAERNISHPSRLAKSTTSKLIGSLC